jgi:hypothetical protein
MNRNTIRRLAAGLALAIVALSGHAADAEAVARARAVFAKAVAGESSAVKTASEQFKQLHEREPDHVLLRAFWGSCLTLQGREALMPWNKLRYVEDGLAQIDKALGQLSPEKDAELLGGVSIGMETRLIAASTFLKLPDLFRRFDAGKRVVEESLRNPAFATLPPPLQGRFHYQAAVVAKQEKRRADEIASLQRAVEMDPQGPDVVEAKARLKALKA